MSQTHHYTIIFIHFMIIYAFEVAYIYCAYLLHISCQLCSVRSHW